MLEYHQFLSIIYSSAVKNKIIVKILNLKKPIRSPAEFKIKVFGLKAKDISLKIITNKTKKRIKNIKKNRVSAQIAELFISKKFNGNCLSPHARAKEKSQINNEKNSLKNPFKNPLKLKNIRDIKKTMSKIVKATIQIFRL